MMHYENGFSTSIIKYIYYNTLHNNTTLHDTIIMFHTDLIVKSIACQCASKDETKKFFEVHDSGLSRFFFVTQPVVIPII